MRLIFFAIKMFIISITASFIFGASSIGLKTLSDKFNKYYKKTIGSDEKVSERIISLIGEPIDLPNKKDSK
jgi:hypothetical protein